MAALCPLSRAQTVLLGTYDGSMPSGTITGNVSIAPSTSATFINNATFTGTTATFGSSATLNWNQIGVLTGKALAFGTSAAVLVGTADSLTLDSASTASGDVDLSSTNTGASIINQGAITHTSGTGELYAPTLTNSGAISAASGTSLYLGSTSSGYNTTNNSTGTLTANGGNLYLEGNVANLGTITAQNAGALYFQGSNTTGNLGTVAIGTGGGHAYLNGTLDNTSATLTAPTGGSFELYAGTINNGTIGAGALSFTSSGGTLSNVSYSGDLTLPASAYAFFTSGTNFTGTNANLGTSSGIYWNENGTLAGKALTFGNGAYVDVGPSNSLTLDSATTATGDLVLYSPYAGASIVNQGTLTHTTGTGYLYAPTFTNQGTINVGSSTYLYLGNTATGYTFANPAGATINITGGVANLQSALVNAGVINVQSGNFYATTGALTNGPTGTITGSGTITGGLTLAGGNLSPGVGSALGTLTLASGSLIVSNPATLNISLGGTTADELLISGPPGPIAIGSGMLTLNLNLLAAPTASTYNLIAITGGSGFSGYLAGLPLSGNTITSSYLGTPYVFSVQYLGSGVSLNFTPVPEPGPWALIGTGLLVVAGAGWRRRRRAA